MITQVGGAIMSEEKVRSIVDSLLEQSKDLDEAFTSFLNQAKARLAGLLGQKHLRDTREAAGSLSKLRSTVMFVLFDYEGTIIHANSTASDLFGLSVEKVLGRQLMDFYMPEAYDTLERFSEGVEFFHEHGYWFGNACIMSATGDRHDLMAFTFFVEGSSDKPLIGSVGLPIKRLEPFTASDLSDHKKRYIEMTARQRRWNKDQK